MRTHFTTPKGTDLPILNLRGKEYLEIKYRIVWFREEHPTWGIETEILAQDNVGCLARAVIKDDASRVIATSHKSETKNDFPDFIEKSETSAIGRALALIGFGTQFCADELDEGERLADSPAVPKGKPNLQAVSASPNAEALGDFVIGCAPYKGKRLKEIGQHDLDNWVSGWLKKKQAGASITGLLLEAITEGEKYLQQVERKRGSL